MPYRLNDQILLMTTYVPDPAHLLRLMSQMATERKQHYV